MDNKEIVREALLSCDDGYNGQTHDYSLVEQALKALDNLTDTTAFIERLEGIKREYSPAPSVVAPKFNHPSTPDNGTYYINATHNAAIDAAIKKLKEPNET